jgi:hypothetical protein
MWTSSPIVDEQPEVHLEAARRDPCPRADDVPVEILGTLDERCAAGQHVEHRDHRDDPDDEDHPDRHPVRLLAEPSPDERREEEARHRQDEQQRQQRLDRHAELPCTPVIHCLIASYSSTSGVFLLR